MLADCHESEGDLLLVLSEGDSHFRRSMVMIIPNDIFQGREAKIHFISENLSPSQESCLLFDFWLKLMTM